jgi:hypothetical protein
MRLRELASIVMVTLMLLAGPCLQSGHAQDVHSTCVETHLDPSKCVISTPKILNIYWNTSAAQWDADAGPAFTQARIDAHSLALTRSSYFSQLEQYHVAAPEFIGSVTAGTCASPPRGVVNMGEMAAIVMCARNAQPDRFAGVNLVALFVPPQSSPAWVTGDIFGAQFELGDCPDYTAFHLLEPGMPDLPIAFVPLNFKCNASFPALFFSYTHELVEAMVDPDPITALGYVDTVLADRITFLTTVLPPEIADVCPAATPFLDGKVSEYWSQAAGAAGACVRGFASTAAPVVTSVGLCGSGRNMRINVIGSGFGSPPPDLPPFSLANAATASSLYFRFVDPAPSPPACGSSSGWEGGHAFDPLDTGVRVQFQSWTDSAIAIGGFGGTYGAGGKLARPGDPVVVAVRSSGNGQEACALAMIPRPSQIGLTTSAPLTVGDHGAIEGVVRDSGGCGQDAIAVTLTASAGTLAGTATTDSFGGFTADFTPPAEDGPVTIAARLNAPPLTRFAAIPIAPVMDTIAPLFGDVAGGTVVTMTGRGFVNNETVVNFGAGNPAAAQVQSPTRLTVVVPPSAGAGDVPIGVSVRGVPAAAVRLFSYIVPFAPSLQFSDASCGSAVLSAHVFDHQGRPVGGEPVTLTAVAGQFVSGSASSTSVTLSTDAAGQVKVKMATTGASPNELAASVSE